MFLLPDVAEFDAEEIVEQGAQADDGGELADDGPGGGDGGAQPQVATLYRDSQDDRGVTVHRGRMTPVASVAEAPATGAATADAPAPRMMIAAGVRVHRGSEAPRRLVTEGAVIGAESDPT